MTTPYRERPREDLLKEIDQLKGTVDSKEKALNEMRETLRGERQNLVWKAVKKNAQLILVSTLLANAAVIFIQGFVWFASHGKYNPPTANVAIFTGLLAAAFVVTHWRK